MALIAFCCYFKVPEVPKKVITEKVPIPEKAPASILSTEEVTPLKGIYFLLILFLFLGLTFFFLSLVVYPYMFCVLYVYCIFVCFIVLVSFLQNLQICCVTVSQFLNLLGNQKLLARCRWLPLRNLRLLQQEVFSFYFFSVYFIC